MENITVLSLRKKKYPINLSVKAMKLICQRHGSVDEFINKLGELPQAEQLDELVWVFSVLMEQGAQLAHLESGAEIAIPTVDELEVLIDAPFIGNLWAALTSAISAGMAREIELEVAEEKNGIATPV